MALMPLKPLKPLRQPMKVVKAMFYQIGTMVVICSKTIVQRLPTMTIKSTTSQILESLTWRWC